VAAARPRGATGVLHFPFAFDQRVGILARLIGVRPSRAGVEIEAGSLTVRFGRWTLRTDIENVAAVAVTGPYAWWKVAGPPHLSIVDRGITFATTTSCGLCITFHEPVPALLPVDAVRHPSTTVTVADPEGLARAIKAAADLP
jgi:hypothetical protein